MTFAAQIDRQASQRFVLARIRPARDITSSFAAAGGGVYTMTFAYPLYDLKRNGTALTPTTSNPPTVNDTYYWDESTSTLKVKLASAPAQPASIGSTGNLLIATYSLFFSSSDAGVVAPETPTDTTTTKRLWEPRIDQSPTFGGSFEDVLAGVLTIADSSITLRNDDKALRAYFSDDDSLFQRDIDIWLSVDGYENVKLVYHGRCRQATLAGNGPITIPFYDDLARLKRPAYMGDTSDESIFKNTYTVPSRFYDRPIPYHFGHSRHRLKQPFRRSGTSSGSGWPPLQTLDHEQCEEAAFNATPAVTPSGTTNRGPFILGRVPSVKTLNFGTVLLATLWATSKLKLDYNGTDRGVLVIETASDDNLEVGDSFSWSHASVNGGATQYAVVMGFATSANGRGVTCMVLSRSSIAADVTVTTATFNTNSAPAIVAYNPNLPYRYFTLCYGLDFTVTTTATSGGNVLVTITFVNNFDSNATTNIDTMPYHPDFGNTGTASSYYDPARHIIAYRMSSGTTSSNARHGKAAQKLLEAAGLTVNTTSITDANTTLAVNASFSIPAYGESSYRTTVEYLQELLRSTLGYVKIDPETSQVGYYLLAAPSSSDTVDDDVYGEDGVTVEIDYRDIVTELTVFNPQIPLGQVTYDNFLYASRTKTDYRAKYLHGIDVSLVLPSYLDDVSQRNSAQLAVRSSRRAVYRFTVATKFLDGLVGQDFQLDSTDLLGADTSRDLKIVGLTKSAETVDVEATDLEGL